MLYRDLDSQDPERHEFMSEACLFAWDLFLNEHPADSEEDEAQRVSAYGFKCEDAASRGGCFTRYDYTYTLLMTNGRDDTEMLLNRDMCHFLIESLTSEIDKVWQGIEPLTRDDIIEASSTMHKLTEYILAISDISRTLEILSLDLNTQKEK